MRKGKPNSTLHGAAWVGSWEATPAHPPPVCPHMLDSSRARMGQENLALQPHWFGVTTGFFCTLPPLWEGNGL